VTGEFERRCIDPGVASFPALDGNPDNLDVRGVGRVEKLGLLVRNLGLVPRDVIGGVEGLLSCKSEGEERLFGG